MKLRDIQASMFKQLMRPLDCSTAEADEPLAVRDAEFTLAAKKLMKPGRTLAAVDRLELYSRQYWYRVLDSLLEDFAALHAILGAEKFDTLLTAYLARYPSASYTLRDLGKKLPQFILEEPDLTAPLEELSWQTAAVEWAAIEAFDRRAQKSITAAALSGTPPTLLKLKLQDYLTVLELDYALDDFVLQIAKCSALHSIPTAQAGRTRRKAGRKLPLKKHIYLVVHRLKNVVYYKRIDKLEYVVLTHLRDGASLGEACAKLVDLHKKEDLADLGNRLKNAFSTWTELGWLIEASSGDRASV